MDINNRITQIIYDHLGDRLHSDNVRNAANEIAQLLLPQLQQLREENEIFEEHQKTLVHRAVELQREIERQKSQIEQLREEVNEYCRNLHNCVDTGGKLVHEKILLQREIEQQKSQIQAQQEEIKQLKEKYRLLKSDYDLWLNRWQIDMDANKKTSAEQAAEIESLKQQNERLVKERDEQKAANKYPKPSGYDEFGAMYDDSPY